MAKKVKDYYDLKYLHELADLIKSSCKELDKEKFLQLTENKIETLEFNQRQDVIAKALYESLDLGYEDSIQRFYSFLGPVLKGNSGAFSEGWWLWPIGRYVELYGEDYFEVSIDFSKELTKRFTSEFCMRPLIKKYPEKSMKVLLEWSKDENERVRRLSSECLRIRLPWAKKLYVGVEHFDHYVEILSNLKDDKDKYIQKSVANNLNDLYKEYPEKFYTIVESWKSQAMSKECEWVIKHGSRNVKYFSFPS